MNFSMKKSRFEEIRGAIPGKKVLILGDVGVDRYTVGTASRLSPEAPVPVLLVSSQTDKLGMAANVADNVRAFGAAPLLCSVVGEDRVCEEFYELLAKSGIEGKHVHRHGSRRFAGYGRHPRRDQLPQVGRGDSRSATAVPGLRGQGR